MSKASQDALGAWVLKTHPGLFATILKHRGHTLGALGDDSIDVTAIDPSSISVDMPDLSAPADIPNIDTSAADVSTPSLVSSLGSNIGSAISDVGSFLLKGTAIVAPVAVAALQASSANANKTAQLAVLQTQTQRAAAGMAPATIAYTATGQPVYVPSAPANNGLVTLPAGLGAPVTLSSGQTGYTLTPSALSNLTPSFLQKYGVLLIGGGAVLVLALLFS